MTIDKVCEVPITPHQENLIKYTESKVVIKDYNFLSTSEFFRIYYGWMDGWMDELCFRPLLCTVKAELGRGQPGLMRWNIAPEQYRSLDLLLCSSPRYQVS